jgi:hypothetical protein
MPEKIKLETGEQELMRNLGAFAARRAVNGVYLGTFYHIGVGANMLVAIALGEQADALQRILLSHTQPDEATILNVSGGKEFLDGDDGNGH